MDKTKSITISQNDFHRIFIEETKELAGIDLIAPYILARVGAAVECALFCKLEEEEKPFKVDDMAFVVDNSKDDNNFVNQIVAVREVCDDCCIVSNGKIKQIVNFENLRKIKNG